MRRAIARHFGVGAVEKQRAVERRFERDVAHGDVLRVAESPDRIPAAVDDRIRSGNVFADQLGVEVELHRAASQIGRAEIERGGHAGGVGRLEQHRAAAIERGLDILHVGGIGTGRIHHRRGGRGAREAGDEQRHQNAQGQRRGHGALLGIGARIIP